MKLFHNLLVILSTGLTVVSSQCTTTTPCRLFNMTAAKRYAPDLYVDGSITATGSSSSASFDGKAMTTILPKFLNISYGNSGDQMATISLTLSNTVPVSCSYKGIGVYSPWTDAEKQQANAYQFVSCNDVYNGGTTTGLPALQPGSQISIQQITVRVNNGGNTGAGDYTQVYLTLQELPSLKNQCQIRTPSSMAVLAGNGQISGQVFGGVFAEPIITLSCVDVTPVITPNAVSTPPVIISTPPAEVSSSVDPVIVTTQVYVTTVSDMPISSPVLISTPIAQWTAVVTPTLTDTPAPQPNISSGSETNGGIFGGPMTMITLVIIAAAAGLLIIICCCCVVFCRRRCIAAENDYRDEEKGKVYGSKDSVGGSADTLVARDFSDVIGYDDQEEVGRHGSSAKKDMITEQSLDGPMDCTLMNDQKAIAFPAFLKYDYQADFRAEDKNLAEGGGGIVQVAELLNESLRAHHRIRKVAIKLVKNSANLSHDIFQAAFQQEVAIMYALVHQENVVKIVAYTDTPLAIVMRFYSQALSDLIQDESLHHLLTVETKFRFSYHVVSAMRAIHEAGIVHRDLKTANLLIDAPAASDVMFWKVVVCDFGLAKILGETDVKEAKNISVRGISIRYAAPEVFSRFYSKKPHNGQDDAAAEEQDSSANQDLGEEEKKGDVYAYSMIQWELLEQGSVWAGMSNQEIEFQVRNGNRPSISEAVVKASQTNHLVDSMVRIMNECWHQDFIQRPSFEALFDNIQPKYQALPRADRGSQSVSRQSYNDLSAMYRRPTHESATSSIRERANTSRPLSLFSMNHARANTTITGSLKTTTTQGRNRKYKSVGIFDKK